MNRQLSLLIGFFSVIWLAACHPNTLLPDNTPKASQTMPTLAPLTSPYTRQFPKSSPVHPTLIGAYYYPWYGVAGRHWNEGYKGTPLLGQYGCDDLATMNRHIDWATGHGIDFWVMSWWGQGSFEDTTIQNYYLKADLAQDIQFAILYESAGLLKMKDGLFDMSDPDNRQALTSDLRYLAQAYFDQPNYLHVDGKATVFVYLTRIFSGDVKGAFQEARDAVKQATGKEMFIIGDEVYWHSPSRDRLTLWDGVTAYNMHTSVPDVDKNFTRNVLATYQAWAQAAQDAGVSFIPDVLPGFDDTAVRPEAKHPVIPRSSDLFRQQLEGALPLANGAVRMLTITSWNEWHEYTSIEPAEEFGFQYLDVLLETLKGQK